MAVPQQALIEEATSGGEGRDEGDGDGSTLAVGDTAQIRVVVSVSCLADQGLGLGNYRNQVKATAEGTGGNVVSDFSDAGTDPDPNGNGDPTEAGEDDPTDFSISINPIIGLAKNVEIMGAATANLDVGGVNGVDTGTKVAITWYVENLGLVDLSNITLTDDLNATFGAGNYGTIVSGALPEVTVSGTGTINVNTSYNGSTQTNVLNAGCTLAPGSRAVIRTEVVVTTITDQGSGLGVYYNQATANADGPSGSTSDLSDSGDLTDPNGNGDPTEAGEDDPTPIIIGAALGAAKAVTVVANVVTMDIYLEAFGSVTLTEIAVTDNLDGVFGVGNYSISSSPVFLDDPGTISLNPAFDGSSDTNLVAAGSSLAPSDTAQIRFVVTVTGLTNQGNGLGVYSNQVLASSTLPSGLTVFDESESGTNPDPDDDDDPATAGGENTRTSFTITTDAVTGVAKTAIVSGTQVTVNLYLAAFGAATSSNLVLSDDLDAVLGAGNYTISSAPSLIADPGTLVLNGSYDGSSDIQILDDGSTLAAGSTAQIQFVVDVDTISDQGFGYAVYKNQATVTAYNSLGVSITDLSDSGTDPDPTGDGDPTYPGLADPPTPGEDDPTSFVIGNVALGAALHSMVKGTVITYDYYFENLGDVTITGISVTQNLFSVFGFGNFSVSQPPVLMEGSGSLTPITNFDGTFAQTLVSGGVLAPGELAWIRLAINVTNVTDQGFGFGIYYTQVPANGLSPLGTTVSDLSDDGILTDPNGNGDPTEAGENTLTVSVIGDEASLGVAKEATVIGTQVTFNLYLENLGNVTLSSLSLAEDLDNVLGAGNYSIITSPTLIDDPGTIALNPAFDGSADVEMISAGSTLFFADTAQIQFVVDITTITDVGLGVGSYENQVVFSGESPLGAVAMDLSDDGTDPDPNGNSNASDSGESDATGFVVFESGIGVAKDTIVNGAEVTLDFYLENLGNTSLNNVSLPDDLNAVFGEGNYSIVSSPVFVTPMRNLILNPNFNGGTANELISGGTIDVGVFEQLRVVIRVDEVTDRGSGVGVYSNQVTVSAQDPTTSVVTDLSDDGTDPDPNGNAAADDAGEGDPTTFTLEVDFGDAPDPTYPTLLASNGARHVLGGSLLLGSAVDAEADGKPSANSDGDDTAGSADEDGIIFVAIPGTGVTDLVAGETARVDVVASTNGGLLNAWIDFNTNGDWSDPGEQVFTDEALSAGTNSLSFPVPATATVGSTHARFRLDSSGGLSPMGTASDGEVEDYSVTVLNLDYGDAPDPSYPTLRSANGARHILHGGPYLGEAVDSDTDGQPAAAADGDDTDGDGDDEDGVFFTTLLVAGQQADATLVTTGGTGFLNAWIDFDGNGSWADAGEQIATDLSLSLGTNPLSFTVPSTAAVGPTIARFRFDTGGGLSFDGLAADGEVEDYEVTILAPTPTPTSTPTATETFTETFTPTATETFTETFTPTATGTFTPTPTESFTPTATETPTASLTPTDSPTQTPTETQTETPTETSTPTETLEETATPTASLPIGPAYIHSPADGSIISGTAVTVEARTLQGSLLDIASVEFQQNSGSGWQTLGNISSGTNPDSIPPYLLGWDTLLEPTGPVQLRSKLTTTDSSEILSPTIEVTIDPNNATTRTGVNGAGNFESSTVVSATEGGRVHVGDPESGTTVSAEVLPGAVTEEAQLIVELVPTEQIAHLLPPGTEASSVLALNVYMSNGQTSFDPPIVLYASYPDVDNNGFVDGTTVLETTLQLAFLNSQGEFEFLPNQILDTINNWISATTDHLSFFVLTAQISPTPIPTDTPTEDIPPTPTDTPTEGPSPTASDTPTEGSSPTPSETPTERPSPTPTSTEVATEEPTATSTLTPSPQDFVCDSGYYVLDSLGGRHRVGNPVLITGPLYFGNDIARDMERMVCQEEEDLAVLDGLGGVHVVESPSCEIQQDFYFGDVDTEAFPQGRAVDLEMAENSTGFWVLTDFSGIFRAGTTKGPADPALVPDTDLQGTLGFDLPLGDLRDPNLPENDRSSLRAVSLAVIDTDLDGVADGYLVLDSMGGRLHYHPDGSQVTAGSSAGMTGNEPERLLDPDAYIWPFFKGLDIARDMELYPTQEGVVIFDGWGGIHPVPVDIESNPVYFANNRISNADDTPLQTVGMPYVTSGFDDPTTSGIGEIESNPAQYGPDAESIFTDLEFSAGCPDGLYTLDKFGGVFVLGAARDDETEAIPHFGNSPYFLPFLYAEDIEIFGWDESQFDRPDATPTPVETDFRLFSW